MKKLFLSLFIFCSLNLFASVYTPNDSYIHGLASLSFYIEEYRHRLKETKKQQPKKPTQQMPLPSNRPPRIKFSISEINHLWKVIYNGAANSQNSDNHLALFEQAYNEYKQALFEHQFDRKAETRQLLEKTSTILTQLWQCALEEESPFFINSLDERDREDPNVINNPFISKIAAQAMAPYLLPLKHPMRKMLDLLFLKTRATLNRDSFINSRFSILTHGPRSHVIVAKHPLMPNYLVKAYLDSELKQKHHRESWEWLVRRCEGAKKIRHIIRKREIRHFTVPGKWIYCFPKSPSPPPNDSRYTHHLALLLTQDMKLVPNRQNLDAWNHLITEEHLDEFFEIITRAKGSSYRPDNIAYTQKGQFAFIDTEYPAYGPDLKSIRYYLNEEMRDYWDRLIKGGGPSSIPKVKA